MNEPFTNTQAALIAIVQYRQKMIQFFGGTHTGKRQHNEDCYAINDELGVGLVADGMGGYACGEVASALVKEVLLDGLSKQQGLTEAIVKAHSIIRDEADKDDSKKGMGSTVVVTKTTGFDYEIAWVGDSRAYIWDGALKQITRDHSYVESLLVSGVIDVEEARDHPNKNLITQAVGANCEGGLDIGVVNGRLASGQLLLLCSDGLVDEISDVDIAKLLASTNDYQYLVDNLIITAFEAGGSDNITVVIAVAEYADNTIVNDNAKAIEPYVVCTTTLDGYSERNELPEADEAVTVDEDEVTANEKNNSIDMDADIDVRDKNKHLNYSLLAAACLTILVIIWLAYS